MPKQQQHLKVIADSAMTPLGPGTATGLLAEVLVLENASKPDRKELHVSDLGRCPRQVSYRLLGVKESDPTTVDSLVNFAVGTGVEDRIIDLLEKHKAVTKVHRQVDFEIYHNNHTIYGHADLLLELEGFDELYEIKTINSRAMGWMLKRGENGKVDHRKQNAGYLYASHFPNSPVKPKKVGKILYIVKDATKGEPPMWEATVDLADELDGITEDMNVLAQVERDAENGTLQPIPDGNKFGEYPCNYCAWQHTCHGYATTILEDTHE